MSCRIISMLLKEIIVLTLFTRPASLPPSLPPSLPLYLAAQLMQGRGDGDAGIAAHQLKGNKPREGWREGKEGGRVHVNRKWPRRRDPSLPPSHSSFYVLMQLARLHNDNAPLRSVLEVQRVSVPDSQPRRSGVGRDLGKGREGGREGGTEVSTSAACKCCQWTSPAQRCPP